MKKFLTILALVATTTSLSAQFYTVALNGFQEIPPNASPGFGSGTLSLSGSNLVWNISFTNLLSGVSSAHIHGPAGFGTNAGVLLNLFPPTGVTFGNITGFSTNASPALIAALNSSLTYVNIHTSGFPGGEIRGQIQVVPEPSTLALAGLGLLTLVAVRRWA